MPDPFELVTDGDVPANPSTAFESLLTDGLSSIPNPASPRPGITPPTFPVQRTLEEREKEQRSSGQSPDLVLTRTSSQQAVAVPNNQAVFFSEGVLRENRAIAQNPDVLHSYAGSDVRVIVDMPGAGRRLLLECSTLTVSIHREKIPVRACGFNNPRGFARGKRTIAGTMVLTQFTVDVLYRFLASMNIKDLSKDTIYKKVDQLPAFNLTVMLSDEYGNASFRRLLGVEALTDGTVYSINDMYTEQTLQYMAADFTPLVPVGFDPVYQGRTPAERSGRDVLAGETPSVSSSMGNFGTATSDVHYLGIDEPVPYELPPATVTRAPESDSYSEPVVKLSRAIATIEGYYADGSNIPKRRNNPGNIKDPSTNTIRTFPTPNEGWDALYHQVWLMLSGGSSIYRPTMTFQEVAEHYVGPGGGDPTAWARTVSGLVGLKPTDPISKVS